MAIKVNKKYYYCSVDKSLIEFKCPMFPCSCKTKECNDVYMLKKVKLGRVKSK